MFKRIFTGFVCICVTLVFACTIADYLDTKLSSSYMVTSGTTYDEEWDGSADYPCEDDIVASGDEATESVESDGNTQIFVRIAAGVIRKIKNRFVLTTSDWTERVTTASSFYYDSIVISKLFDRLCGFNITTSVSAENDTLDAYDVVIDHRDGYLISITDQESITSFGTENIESLVEFGTGMVDDGRNFLFVEAPTKTEVTEYSGIISDVYPDFSSELADMVMEALNDANLDALSMLEYMEEDGFASLDAFYKTDHHWNVRAGLYSCGIIGEYLNMSYGYEIDTSLFDLSNYTVDTIENYWLGSLGRKSTEVYTSLEDLEIILPAYDTDLEVYRSDTNAAYYGSIEETMFDWGGWLQNIINTRSAFTLSSDMEI